MKKILIDVGSSTVKVYEFLNEKLSLILQKSILFKNDFDPEKGISQQSKQDLFELFKTIKSKNNEIPIEVYATEIFRKISPSTKQEFIKEVLNITGLNFNIISQEQESYYLTKALIDKCALSDPILIINIGGGSTELIVIKNQQVLEKHNINFGVGTIITQFPDINNSLSIVPITTVVDYVKELLPILENNPKIAFYTGGELNYMTLANYPLKSNILFDDSDHPSVISLKDFQIKNKEVFEKITFKELEDLMPQNPKWMYGARTCCAIAQAICEKYLVTIIIPSNSNIINGVVRE